MALQAILAQAARAAAKKQYVEKLGRTVYRNAKGRMISYATYKQLRSEAKMNEARLRKEWGKPPSNYTWMRLANKYPERFAGYL